MTRIQNSFEVVPRPPVRLKDAGKENGFSLVGILIALSLMGFVGIAMARLISNLMTAQSISQSRQDLLNLTNEMQTLISTPPSCKSGIVKPTKFDATLASFVYPPPASSSPSSTNGMPFKYKINADVLEDGTPLKTYALVTNYVRLVNAVNMGVDTAGNQVYRAQIIGQFSPRAGTGGLKDFSIRVLGTSYFTIVAGNIESCSPDSPLDINKVSATCAALGGIYDLTTKKCNFGFNPADPAFASAVCTVIKGGTFVDGKCVVPTSTGPGPASTGGARWIITGTLDVPYVVGRQLGPPYRCNGNGQPTPANCEIDITNCPISSAPQLSALCTAGWTCSAGAQGTQNVVTQIWTCM